MSSTIHSILVECCYFKVYRLNLRFNQYSSKLLMNLKIKNKIINKSVVSPKIVVALLRVSLGCNTWRDDTMITASLSAARDRIHDDLGRLVGCHIECGAASYMSFVDNNCLRGDLNLCRKDHRISVQDEHHKRLPRGRLYGIHIMWGVSPCNF